MLKSLLDYFKPQNYKLSLKLDPSHNCFSGTVIISGEPRSNEIQLNVGNQLNITDVASGIEDHPKWSIADGILIVQTQATWISIQFESEELDTNAMTGLYIASTDERGYGTMFATQFEPNYAQQCFPCIDEPAAKATFDIDVTLSKRYNDWTVLSNMPESRRVGTRRYFQTTPVMSPYLVAIVAGDLAKKSATTKSGTAVNVYAAKSQDPDMFDFALETAVASLEFYEDYFGVKYPLPKLDNVAVPSFSAGAMENWGLITYRESMLLAYLDSAVDVREGIVSTVAHEIAHQWFGDLVTMRWWNDLWLNESFASLMEDICGDHLHPEFHVWEEFAAGEAFAAMRRDTFADVQAVRQDVDDPREIPLLFDGAIVYAKGKRLLKMLLRYIGEDAFRNGLKNYFESNQYGNTTADDLWDALSATSGKDIAELMTPWLTQPGYPLVTVEQHGRTVTLRQTRAGGADDDYDLWPIPLFCSDSAAPELMTDKTMKFKISDKKPLQLNMGDDAHFVTYYDMATDEELYDEFAQMQALDQIKFLNDSIILAELLGPLDFERTISFIPDAIEVSSPAVLSAIARIVGFVRSLDNSIDNEGFRTIVGASFYPHYKKLFVDKHSRELTTDERKIIPTVLAMEIYAEKDEVIKGALDIFHHQDIASYDHDARALIMGVAAAHGTDSDFAKLWNMYLGTNDPELLSDITSALCATRSRKTTYQLLSYLHTDAIRAQDLPSFVIQLLANRHTHTVAWHWILDNWDYIMKLYSSDMAYEEFIRAAGATIRDRELQEEFRNTFRGFAMVFPPISRTVDIASEQIERRIRLSMACQPIIDEFVRMYMDKDDDDDDIYG